MVYKKRVWAEAWHFESIICNPRWWLAFWKMEDIFFVWGFIKKSSGDQCGINISSIGGSKRADRHVWFGCRSCIFDDPSRKKKKVKKTSNCCWTFHVSLAVLCISSASLHHYFKSSSANTLSALPGRYPQHRWLQRHRPLQLPFRLSARWDDKGYYIHLKNSSCLWHTCWKAD